jgi:peptidoglycan/xylan/chitin deacetylase (PgdA/CDA1 family)
MTVLMYHDVVADGGDDRSGFPGRDAARYKVTTARFEEHVGAVVDRVPGSGFRVQGSVENRENPKNPELATLNPLPVFTFDDGGVSAIAAADILERHGFVGHFFVTTNYIGTRGFLDAAQIRDLHARGHVIGSHSCSHPLRMGHCPWPQLVDEWSQSRATLEDILRCEVRNASVPGGDFAPSVAEAAARAGIEHLFTSEPTANVRRAFGLDLQGRFTIQRWTSSDTVRDLAAGDWLPRARQAVVWNAKKLTKRIGGERYLHLRQLLIGHGNEVRWGDTIMRE